MNRVPAASRMNMVRVVVEVRKAIMRIKGDSRRRGKRPHRPYQRGTTVQAATGDIFKIVRFNSVFCAPKPGHLCVVRSPEASSLIRAVAPELDTHIPDIGCSKRAWRHRPLRFGVLGGRRAPSVIRTEVGPLRRPCDSSWVEPGPIHQLDKRWAQRVVPCFDKWPQAYRGPREETFFIPRLRGG